MCSYPPDSVGMVKAVNEIGFKPKMIGGGMVGLQATAIKTQLGPMLNGFVNYDFWLPVPKMNFPGVADFMAKYQAKAPARKASIRSATTSAPWGYAQMQVLEQAVAATKSLDDDKLADYIRANTFKTVVGDVKFGKDGEWAAVARAAGPVPERQGQRSRAVQGYGDPGRRDAGGIRVRQGDLSVREGEVGGYAERSRSTAARNHTPRGASFS